MNKTGVGTCKWQSDQRCALPFNSLRGLRTCFVAAALCQPFHPVKLNCPLQVLVLASSTFQPFPLDVKQGPSIVHKVSGKQLQLRPYGQAARDAFASQV